ncbi:MAG: Ribonuclease HI [Candidatus Latescibacteria bacterium ADurb.Bin168]|nr:MAG: Ribonuclease HI [Candidatus Latescibacteria bacterium ADurb.Bin168]
MKEIRIHTDGACSGNPGPGGWAAILKYGTHRKSLFGAEPQTTNNRMELRAAIEALRALKEPCNVVVVTDSRYLRDGITKWLPNWKRNGWKTSAKDPVKNQDLWEALDCLTGVHSVRWEWVEGHSGDPDNEACDVLAVTAMKKLRPRAPAAGTRSRPTPGVTHRDD